jgi:hypothetical protein
MGIGIRAGGASFNGAANQVYVTELLGLSQSVASGVQTAPIRLQSASNIQVIRDTNKQLGGTGDAVALAVVFRVRYSVDVAAVGGASPAFRATKGIRERYALSTLSIKPGKAGQGYTMSRGETSIGLLMAMLDDTRIASQTMRAVRQATPGYAVTKDRNALNGDNIATASIDSTMLTAARNLINDEQRRVVASGTAITVPETGDQYEDVIVFPLTADGMHGVFTSGFSIEDLFSATNTWEFLFRPVFDADIYSAGSTLNGTFSIDLSVAWRPGGLAKNRKGKPVNETYGKVWQWNNNIGTVVQGTLQTLPGPAVQNHVEVGYPVIVYGESTSTVPVVDGANYFFQEIIPGSGTALKCRLMPCNVTPASLNTQAIYLQVGRENGENTFPLGGWNLAKGNESLLRWNSSFLARAVPGYNKNIHGAAYGTHCESQELPLFSSTGVRSNATAFVVRTEPTSLYYGTAWSVGGALVPAIQAPKSDTVTELDMGGLLHFPIAFSDRSVDGFFGTEVRPAGDLSGITVLTIGGFQLPQAKYSIAGTQNPANVNVMRVLTDYAGFSTDPCACNHDMAEPAVFNTATPNAALGIALTTSVTEKKPTVL